MASATKSILANPIVEIVLALVVILVIATLTFAGAISGALTAASVTIVGLLSLVGLIWVLKKVGSQ
jgi:hypothetical protein